MKKFFQSIRKKLCENKGFSYLEFSVFIMTVTMIIYFLFQVFAVINVYVLVMNTCQDTLRQVSVYGRVPNDLVQDVKAEIKKYDNVKSVQVEIDPSSGHIQLRTPITVKISADYEIGVGGYMTTITLNSKYFGSSERFFKDEGFNEQDLMIE